MSSSDRMRISQGITTCSSKRTFSGLACQLAVCAQMHQHMEPEVNVNQSTSSNDPNARIRKLLEQYQNEINDSTRHGEIFDLLRTFATRRQFHMNTATAASFPSRH